MVTSEEKTKHKEELFVKTFIIDSVVTSYLGFENSICETGKEETKISSELSDYVQKLVEKALKSTSLKEVRVGSQHELFSCLNEKKAEKVAADIARHFYSAGKSADSAPDASLVTAKGKLGGEPALIVIKTDHKPSPYNDADSSNVRIVRRQLLPSSPKADEAVIVCGDRVFIIEKKYTVDGKGKMILNDSWIHGETSMTDRQKENAVKKIIKDVQKETLDMTYIPKLKSYLSQNAVTGAPVGVGETVEAVIGRDADEYLEAEGIRKDEEIQNYSESSKVTITTDSGVKITVEADEMLSGKNIVIDDGKITVTGFGEYKIS